MTYDDIKRALYSDSIDLISSFVLPIPIPMKLISVVFERMRQNPVNKYLNVKSDELISYYKHEHGDLLELTFNNQTEILPQLLVIDNTSERLKADQFIFNFKTEMFKLKEEFRSKTSPAFNDIIKNTKYINKENLRLFKVEKQDDHYIFHTQPVFYETYIHTNLLIDYQYNDKEKVRSIIHPDGKIEEFEDSLLANHIGVNVLVFTPQGDLIIPVRSKKVSYAPLELAASISGAVTANDVSQGRPIQEHVIIREGLEELGIKRNEIIEESIQFLGLTRELLRGGKPEIFFVLQTKLSYYQIVERWKQAEDRWESTKLLKFSFGKFANQQPLEKDRQEFEELMVSFFQEFGSNMSLPFITNIALWMKAKRSFCE